MALCVLLVCPPLIAATPEPPSSVEELIDRMKEALTAETSADFLALFWREGMDDEVRGALDSAISRHLGSKIARVEIDPPGDCSWCDWERNGKTYQLPFEPDGWIKFAFSHPPPEPGAKRWVEPGLGHPFKAIEGQFFLICSVPQGE
jgi:hypothetical protein